MRSPTYCYSSHYGDQKVNGFGSTPSIAMDRCISAVLDAANYEKKRRERALAKHMTYSAQEQVVTVKKTA